MQSILRTDKKQLQSPPERKASHESSFLTSIAPTSTEWFTFETLKANGLVESQNARAGSLDGEWQSAALNSPEQGDRKVKFGKNPTRNPPPRADAPIAPEDLLRNDIFSFLTIDQAEDLIFKSTMISITAGKQLISQGDTSASCMYLLIYGFMQVRIEGRVVAVKRLGDLVGEVCVFGSLWPRLRQGNETLSCNIPSCRTAAVVACSDCELLCIPGDALFPVMVANRSAKEKFQNEAVRVTLLAAVQGSAEARLATASTPREQRKRFIPPVNNGKLRGEAPRAEVRVPRDFDEIAQGLVMDDAGLVRLVENERRGKEAEDADQWALTGMLSLLTSVQENFTISDILSPDREPTREEEESVRRATEYVTALERMSEGKPRRRVSAYKAEFLTVL
mmetsp:Transcript_7923/g.15760  ORF Transcript_7923/g.15760 Transcript_7923/m.15760 type:complete len:393 (+) Transcript_7923:95-1273(+)